MENLKRRAVAEICRENKISQHCPASGYILTKEFMSKTSCNTNVVIVRLDRTIQCLLDSPIKSGNDDYVALLMVLLVYPSL